MTATGRVIATSSMAIASELLHGAESPDTALSALQHFSTHSGGGANSPPQLNFAHYLFSEKPGGARFFSKP